MNGFAQLCGAAANAEEKIQLLMYSRNWKGNQAQFNGVMNGSFNLVQWILCGPGGRGGRVCPSHVGDIRPSPFRCWKVKRVS